MNLIVLFILAVILMPVFLLLYIRVKPATMANISALTSTLQFYIFPISGIYFSVSFIAGLLSIKTLSNFRYVQFTWLKIFMLMEAVRVLSIIWSPDMVLGVRYIIYEAIFLFVLCAFANSESSKSTAVKVIKYSLLLISINAILVIIFRVNPFFEDTFLNSSIARLFISGNVLDGLVNGYMLNNVLDPDKAGGVFVNGNISSVFLGVGAVGGWFFGKAFKSNMLMFSAFICWIAVFFSGSKAGAVYAIVIPSLVVFLHMFATQRLNARAIIRAIIIVISIMLIVYVLNQFVLDADFADKSANTLDTRSVIWGFAFDQMVEHPLLGLGFGGWERESASYLFSNGFSYSLPEHNAFLILWSQSGVLAAILGLFFVMSIVYALFKALATNNEEKSYVVRGVLGSFLWSFAHAQGENFGLIGDAHLTPVLAMLIGYAINVGCFNKSNNYSNQ